MQKATLPESRWRRLVRPVCFALALAIVAVASVVMHTQAPRPEPFAPVERGSLDWWLRPIERNAFMRLPLVSGNPHRLFVLPKSTHAWVGGGTSQLLHSADRGQTWEAIRVRANAPPPEEPAQEKPQRQEPAEAAWGFELVTSAYAAAPPVQQQQAPIVPPAIDVMATLTLTAKPAEIVVADLHFDDEKHGFVLDRAGRLLETNDGGATWVSIALSRTAAKYEALAVRGNTIIAGGEGEIAVRRDGAWRLFEVEANVTAVAINDDGTWYAGTDSGSLWKHYPSGQRFETLELGSPIRRIAGDFVETDLGVIPLRAPVNAKPPGRGRVTRGGEVIAAVDLLAVEGFDDGTEISLRRGGRIATAERDAAFVQRTAPYQFVRAIHAAADGERLWAAGNGGTILTSSDGGKTWSPQASGTDGDLASIAFAADGRNGWVVGTEVLRTRNGGASWEQVDVGVDSEFELVTVSADGKRIIIDEFRASVDGGASWQTAEVADVAFSRSPDDRWLVSWADDGSTIRHGDVSDFVNANPITLTALDTMHGWAIGRGGLLRTTSGGRYWERINTRDDFENLTFLSPRDGFAETEDGEKFRTADGGSTWTRVPDGAISWRVAPLVAHADGKRAWTASIDGIPLRSTDGANTFLAPSYARRPAPWYWLTFAPVALLLFVSLRPPAPVKTEDSIEDVPWNDRPLATAEGDRLDFQPLANGISRFLGNPKTEPPLTIAITGSWGSGKSSLMNLVAEGIRRYGHRPVWFNAWHFQSEEHLLPAVMESIRREIPPAWTPSGLQFRMRLLTIRGIDNWLPAVIVAAVLATTAAVVLRDPERFLAIDVEKASTQLFQSLGLVLSSIVSLAVVIRAMNIFGVSGGRIAAFFSSTMRLREAGGETGFRHRFAQSFGEVTRALGAQRLVIFIDDLDRCRPDHVLAVLETINFLVTSGDCFIITGIDRPRVVRCVAMRFKDESAALGADENADGVLETVTPDRYAQLYLEKLINIEVPIPRVPLERSQELVTGVAADDDGELRTTPFGTRVVAIVKPLLQAAAFAGVLALAAWAGYHRLGEPRRAIPAASPVVASVIESSSGVAAPSRSHTSSARSTPERTVAMPARFVVPVLPSRNPLWPLLLVGAIVAAGIVRLSLERARLEQDSPAFKEALRQWHPLLYALNATPRSMKRCVNRVRYYAMRQRHNPLPPTAAERLTNALRALRNEPAPGPVSKGLEIPEPLLVPISVIEHVHPEWVRDAAFWNDPAGFLAKQDLPRNLATGVAALGRYGSIGGYREAFDRISSGVSA